MDQGRVNKKAFFLGLAGLIIFALWLLIHRLAPTHGLQARYYDNDSWQGEPVITRVDQKILFDKIELSNRAGYADSISVVWEGFIYVPKDSRYVLTVSSDDGSWIYLDDSLVIDNGERHPVRNKEREIDLIKGNHKIVIRYFDAGGRGRIDFSWREAIKRPRLFPGFFLYPRPASQALYRFDQARPTLLFGLKWALILLGLGLAFTVIRTALPRRDIVFHLSLCLFLTMALAYGLELFSKRSTAVTGCDTYAYLQGALGMAENGLFRTEFKDPLAAEVYRAFQEHHDDSQTIFFFSPHGHYVFDLRQGLIYNVFPPGVSLLLLPIIKLAGFRASFFTLPLLNLACLLLAFYLAAKYVHVVFGLCFIALAFFNVQVFENSAALMSDVPSMLLLGLSLFCLFKNMRVRHRFLPLVAGAAFGFSLVVRYSNLTGGIPLALILLAPGDKTRGVMAKAGDILRFSCGAILFGLLPLAFYTHRLFGTFIRLVYEPKTQSQLLLSNFGPGSAFYFETTYRTFGGVGILIVLLGLLSCWRSRPRRFVASLCVLGYLCFFLFYAFQSLRNERYLVPAFPFLAILYGYGAMAVWKKWERRRFLGLVTAAILAIYPLVHSWPQFHRGIVGEEKMALAVQSKVGKRAVIMCDDMSGPLRLYAGFSTFRFTWTDDATLRETATILLAWQRPLYFYLDSRSAKDRFLDLTSRAVLEPDRFRMIALINGNPLYRYGSEDMAALTNPPSKR